MLYNVGKFKNFIFGRSNNMGITLLEKYQKQLGITTYKLAKESNVNQDVLRRLKLRKGSPSIENFVKLVAFFDKQTKIDFDIDAFMNDFISGK
jgi:predicted transcriptional regulator